MLSAARILYATTVILALLSGSAAAGPRETLNTALLDISGTARDTPAEARAMEQAIVAARALPSPPAVPDQVIEHLGRAKAAARAASAPRDFLDAAEAFGDASRLAPWVAEHHFNRGLMLEKAGRPDEAIQAFQLYLKAAPNARDARDVRERIAGLRYLKEKESRTMASAAPTFPSGLYYNDGEFQTASTTTLMGHTVITALRVDGGRITCGTLTPANPNFRQSVGFSPHRNGQLEIANATVAFDGTQVTFCDNVRWCPTGTETGYRTGLHVSPGKDNRSLRVRANNCLLKPDYEVLTWHSAQ